MNDVELICKKAKDNSLYVQSLSTEKKNKALEIIADALVKNEGEILKENSLDVSNNSDKPKAFIDRLSLTSARIKTISDGVRELIKLPDPIGEIIEKSTLKNGLKVEKVRVPLGTIGIIFEARPNVSVDALCLCLKSGNSVVLRGSKDSINSNKALVGIAKRALTQNGYNADFIQLLTDTTRESAETLMKCREFVDVLIPRGSANLIRTVVEKSLVPVIETGAGNCHAYVEKTADFDMAKSIILNGKTSRPSVCNSLENMLIDKEIAADFLPQITEELIRNGVEVIGCAESCEICKLIKLASEEDFYTEFLDLKISVKIVGGVKDAVAHINRFGTHHSETIITNDKNASDYFLNSVDSAAVYVNASTRFTDGFEFGLGAEMGISTQKMHARGPMGLKELTSYKYKIYGEGQIRK